MPETQLETWEREILARHRWGKHSEERAQEELARLRDLRDAAGPMDETLEKLVAQVIGPEICNWRLEEMILKLCGAIGRKEPLPFGTGHRATMNEERYHQLWTCYLALRSWLHDTWRSGYKALLALCDPEADVEQHIIGMLGERDELKALHVKRLCLCLDVLLGERFPVDAPQTIAHEATVAAVEEAIRKHDPDSRILGAMKEYRDGEYLAYVNLESCHHKLFRRLDIVLSSIGAGAWRGAMPERGTDGFERADLVEGCLAPMETWIEGKVRAGEGAKDVAARLGEPDPTKVFLASLLVSLLRAQALSARKRADRRAAK